MSLLKGFIMKENSEAAQAEKEQELQTDLLNYITRALCAYRAENPATKNALIACAMRELASMVEAGRLI